MKRSKTQYRTAKNASKLHKKIGTLLAELYPHFEIRQEYAVNQINKQFLSGREKFDWVVLGLKIVIEVHGEQHYGPVCFGGISLAEAKKNFDKRIRVDKEKELAAREAGWGYLIVKYDEQNIAEEELSDRILIAISEIQKPKAKLRPLEKTKPLRQQKLTSTSKLQNRKDYKWPTRKLQTRSILKKHSN
jgi:hypothetical protein